MTTNNDLTAPGDDKGTGSDYDPSVTYINAEVLSPTSSPMSNTANLIADQSAAMMIEDMRSFVQGNEQVLAIAISRCLDQIIKTDGLEGTVALEQCTKFMTELTVFATAMGTAAGGISSDFK